MTFSEVVDGGWSSYETSECQSSSLEKAVGSGRRALSLYTTIGIDHEPLLGNIALVFCCAYHELLRGQVHVGWG